MPATRNEKLQHKTKVSLQHSSTISFALVQVYIKNTLTLTFPLKASRKETLVVNRDSSLKNGEKKSIFSYFGINKYLPIEVNKLKFTKRTGLVGHC